MKVILSHAYSTTNSGDGLLVDEAIQLVRSAFPESEVTVLALDPASFGYAAINPFTGLSRSPSNRELGMAMLGNLLRGRLLGSAARRLLSEADLVVAVGGGYLRGPDCVSLFKTSLAHLAQLPPRRGRGEEAQFVYLPQSIGPFPDWYWPAVRRRLRVAASVHLRDDRSLSQARLPNAIRTPDLAILGADWEATLRRVDQRRSTPARAGGEPRVGLVARDLGRGDRAAKYVQHLETVVDALRPELLLQARARGNNDADFYERAFARSTREDIRSLRDATRSEQNGVDAVVSVRLHGALESIRNGTPAVHLSYERKGWGAYEDLGIDKYVHNAFDFDPQLVANQALELANEPGPFWEAVRGSVERNTIARASLVEAVQRAHGRRS